MAEAVAGPPVVEAEVANRPSSERLISIDALRAVGAIMVLVHHGFWAHIKEPIAERGLFWFAYPFDQGFAGVHLFLVISGFCIHARAARRDPNRNPDFASFWQRRFRRLYPPYLAAVLLTLFSLGVVGAVKAGAGVSFDAFVAALAPKGWSEFALIGVAHLLMLFPFWDYALWAWGNPVFWSLALEEHLYLLYFLIPLFRKRIGMTGMVLMALGVSILWRTISVFGPLDIAAPMHSAGPVVVPEPSAWQQGIVALTWAPARWFEWVLGAYAVELALRREPCHPALRSLPLALVAFGIALFGQWSRIGIVFTDLAWGVAFFLVINCATHFELRGGLGKNPLVRAVGWIGEWSYSLYLVHLPILALCYVTVLDVVPGVKGLVVSMAIAMVGAYGFYRLFEEPSLRWARATRAPDAVPATT